MDPMKVPASIAGEDDLLTTLAVDPSDPRRLYRQIADQLAQFIALKRLPPGTRLPAERDLAEALGVSRPSVREALIALEVEGRVEVRGGSGVVVLDQGGKQRAGHDVSPGPFDVIRARWHIESEAAALAATNATTQHLQQMKLALMDMRRERTHGPKATAADQRFHLAIAQASNNVALLLVIKQLWEMRTGDLYMQLESHFIGEDIWATAFEEHSALMDAIASRDADAAREAMRKHMKNAEIRFASGWRSSDVP
jgi:DNA-binding FadR family transcriptional regulator